MQGFAFYDRLLVAFLAPVLKSALVVTDTQLGLILGSGFALVFSAASFALMTIGTTGIAQSCALPAAIVMWSLATAACGLATSFGELFAARMTMGLAQAALSPLALPMMAAAVPDFRLGRACAIFTSASTLGRSAAMLGGAFVLTWIAVPLWGRDGWRLLFALSALPNLVLALLLLRQRRLDVSAERSSEGLLGWAAANRRSLIAIVGASAAVVLVVQTETAWLTSLLTRRFGLSVGGAGTLFGLVILAAAPAGHALGGWIVDRTPTRHGCSAAVATMAAALVVVLPLVAILAWTRDLVVASAALAGLTFVLGIATPLGPFGIQVIAPPALRGRATAGLLGIVTAVGFGLGPATLGVLNDRVFGPDGIALALLCVCATAAAAGIGFMALTMRKPAD